MRRHLTLAALASSVAVGVGTLALVAGTAVGADPPPGPGQSSQSGQPARDGQPGWPGQIPPVLLGSDPGPTQQQPVGTFLQALLTWADPSAAATPPPGANDPPCRLSRWHPYPVVLVHGTAENQNFNWLELAPILANAGYCVYTFDFGADAYTDGAFYGLGDIAASAAQLQTEVNTVLAQTDAQQVDIVGHSQGGMMPRYYINDLGGASKVHLLVGLAPSNYGTSGDGLLTLGDDLGLTQLLNPVVAQVGEGLVEQEQGSPFLTALNATPTVPSVRYVVIESSDDEVITPYTNAFLPIAPNVQDILLQNQCPQDTTGHIGMAFDWPAIQDTLNALGPDLPWFHPQCSNYGPGI